MSSLSKTNIFYKQSMVLFSKTHFFEKKTMNVLSKTNIFYKKPMALFGKTYHFKKNNEFA